METKGTPVLSSHGRGTELSIQNDEQLIDISIYLLLSFRECLFAIMMVVQSHTYEILIWKDIFKWATTKKSLSSLYILSCFSTIACTMCRCTWEGCGATFSVAYNLKKHEKRHELPNPYTVSCVCSIRSSLWACPVVWRGWLWLFI